MTGKYVVIEGIDGSGKSTAANLLFKLLNYQFGNCELIKEPSDRESGRIVRDFLERYPAGNIIDEYVLFLNDRKTFSEKMKEWLRSGKIVLSDRSYISSMAYQGCEELSMEFIKKTSEDCMPVPDLILFIDIDVDTALKRLKSSGRSMDYMESRVRMKNACDNYHNIFGRLGCFRDRVFRIDGLLSVNQVVSFFYEACRALIADEVPPRV